MTVYCPMPQHSAAAAFALRALVRARRQPQ